jgi:very-short-patch-repair endonuclease
VPRVHTSIMEKLGVSVDTLSNMYLEQNISAKEIATNFNTDLVVIKHYLAYYDIKKPKEMWLKNKNVQGSLFKKGHKVLDEWKEKYRKATKGMKRHISAHTEITKSKMRESAIFRLSSGKMPNKLTTPENIVKNELDNLNIKYIMQYPYKYGIADFYIPQFNAIVECDGNYWHNYPLGTMKDLRNTIYLVSNGYNVYRFWESDIKENIKNCIDQLYGDDNL